MTEKNAGEAEIHCGDHFFGENPKYKDQHRSKENMENYSGA